MSRVILASMIKLSIVPAQLPLLPDPVFSPGDQHLVGKVILHASKPTTIGGLKLYWATTLRHRVPLGKGVKWGRRRVLHCAEVVVLDREQAVSAGKSEFEFMLALPADLLDTRTTHYDSVEHVLTAGLLKTSPCYDHITGTSGTCSPPQFISSPSGATTTAMTAPPTKGTTIVNPRAMRSAFRRLRRVARTHTSSTSPSETDGEQGDKGDGLSGLPILACCSLPVPVFRTCCSVENDSTWRFNYSGVIPNFGAMYKLSMYTPNLAVGGILDVTISLEDMPPNATLHALDLSLVQETTSHQPPPTICGDESPEPDTTTDEYALWSVGQAWLTFPGRARPKAGSYVCRGATALALDMAGTSASTDTSRGPGAYSPPASTIKPLTPGSTSASSSTSAPHARPPSSPVPSPTPSPPTLKTRLHLPSPIIGALPTLEATPAAIATITHHLRLTFRYSILGQDFNGAALPLDSQGHPVEGAVRSWFLEKQVVVGSDTRNAGQTAPPGYIRCAPSTRPRIGLEPDDEGPVVPSASIARRTSAALGDARGRRKWMTGVVVDEKTLRRRTREHWVETEGMCECFCDGRDVNVGLGGRSSVVGCGAAATGAVGHAMAKV